MPTIATLRPGQEPEVLIRLPGHDEDEAIKIAEEIASDHAPDYEVEPVWCGPSAWHPDDELGRPVGGYDVFRDQDHRVSVVVYVSEEDEG